MANFLGVAADPFIQQHKTQITEMQRLILRYVKSLQDMLNTHSHRRAAPGMGSAPGQGSAPGIYIRLTPAGFPELLPSFSARGCTKKQLESLMRQYLAHHYRMFVGPWQPCAHHGFLSRHNFKGS